MALFSTRSLCLASVVALLCGCQSYQMAKDLKYYGFTDTPVKGKTAGPARGEACTYMILGYWLGGPPKVSDALGDMYNKKQTLKYVSGLNTERDGFEIPGIVGRVCTIVKGAGYQ